MSPRSQRGRRIQSPTRAETNWRRSSGVCRGNICWPKTKKTAHELENIIGQRIGVGGVMVSVYPDPAFGWNPTLTTAPSAAGGAQSMLEQTVQELRTEFDFKP
jgi:hypothetical protein